MEGNMAASTAVRSVVAAAEGLIEVGRSDEAGRLFRRALDLEPGDARAAVGLARLLIAAGNLHGAVGVAQMALSCNPDDPQLIMLHGDVGLALYHAQLWEDAEPWLAYATTLEPWNSVVGSAYVRARRPDYLAPEVYDPQTGRSLRRYSAREGDTYIFVIDVVGTCNLRCPTCPVANSPERPNGFMDLALFEQIVTKIRHESPVPHPQINLYNWGEPLLHPDLPAMITMLRRAGMRSHLSSNLNIRRGLEEVIAAGPDELKISLSGFSQETYARTHVRGKLDLVTGNMRRVRAYANDYGVATKIWVGHHIYRSNQHEMEPVRQLCLELGFAYHPIAAFYMPLERLLDVLDGKPNSRDGGILDDLLRKPDDFRREIAKRRGGSFDCELRFNQTVINHDGGVALCCTVYDKPNMLGISYLDEDFKSIEQRKYRHSFCQTCIKNNLQYVPQELNPVPSEAQDTSLTKSVDGVSYAVTTVEQS
jgi:MoaA/NifB/PqqE/SkfB family radical SAM enzyme